MKVERLPVDSEVFGRSVLGLSELAPGDDLTELERRYREEYEPVYVSCRVPLEQPETIHRLEANGFRWIECQIRSTLRLSSDFAVGAHPYRYERVVDRRELDEVLEIAGNTVVHDRFSVDPEVPRGVSGSRYRRYVQSSFERLDESVWRLVDSASGETLAFRSHRDCANGEVLLLLGGVRPDYKTLGLGVLASYFCFNELRARGIRRVVTHISAINYPVFNLEIGSLGFRVSATFAVMRKIYR